MGKRLGIDALADDGAASSASAAPRASTSVPRSRGPSPRPSGARPCASTPGTRARRSPSPSARARSSSRRSRRPAPSPASRTADGALPVPHLFRIGEHVRSGARVAYRPPVTERIPYPPGARETILEGLWRVVNRPGGTAYASRVEGLDICGKTGSVQVVGAEGGEEDAPPPGEAPGPRLVRGVRARGTTRRSSSSSSSRTASTAARPPRRWRRASSRRTCAPGASRRPPLRPRRSRRRRPRAAPPTAERSAAPVRAAAGDLTCRASPRRSRAASTSRSSLAALALSAIGIAMVVSTTSGTPARRPRRPAGPLPRRGPRRGGVLRRLRLPPPPPRLARPLRRLPPAARLAPGLRPDDRGREVLDPALRRLPAPAVRARADLDRPPPRLDPRERRPPLPLARGRSARSSASSRSRWPSSSSSPTSAWRSPTPPSSSRPSTSAGSRAASGGRSSSRAPSPSARSWFVLKDYQKDRIRTFLDPDLAARGAGYQVRQARIAIGSGGILGKGWKEGTQSRLGFLPVRHSDFIFAALAEERGFAGVATVVGLYGLFLARGLRRRARRARPGRLDARPPRRPQRRGAGRREHRHERRRSCRRRASPCRSSPTEARRSSPPGR